MDFTSLRKRMVEEQLIGRGIKDPRVLQAFQKVPRHKFVPEKYQESAYGDFPLSIGSGQTISQPYIVALMTELLKLCGQETVLEIGTGSGYQAAILGELTRQVYTVERVGELARKAKLHLKDSGCENVQVKIGDGTMGWPEFSPYDRMIVTASAPEIPQPLIGQLKVGGKLVIPQGGRLSQMLTLISKQRARIETNQICGCVFVPLLGQYGWAKEDV